MVRGVGSYALNRASASGLSLEGLILGGFSRDVFSGEDRGVLVHLSKAF